MSKNKKNHGDCENKHQKLIKQEELEQFLNETASLGQKLELNKIKTDLVEERLMNKIDFDDYKNVQNLLPLLPEFIYYCSTPNSDSADTTEPKKTIPISNISVLLYKIIDNRETDSIEDIIKEMVSLFFVLDEQNEGSSACSSAMNFAIDMIKDRADYQHEVVLGIRLLSVLINSQFISDKYILNVLNPSKFQEPYVRKNQYIAIREFLSRAGNPNSPSNSCFRKIPYDHKLFEQIISLLANVKLAKSIDKFTKLDELRHDKSTNLVIKKWNNIIIVEKSGKSKTIEIYEYDQWVQCQFIQLLPYIYEIKKNNPKIAAESNYFIYETNTNDNANNGNDNANNNANDNANINANSNKKEVEKKNNGISNILTNYEQIKKLSWNVRLSYLNMLRSSKAILLQSGEILSEFFDKADFNSYFQTASILAIIDFLNEKGKIEDLLKYENTSKQSFISTFIGKAKENIKGVNNKIKENKIEIDEDTFKAQLRFILQIVPIASKLLSSFFEDHIKNENNIKSIFFFMNQFPINSYSICCRIYIDPFFINLPSYFIDDVYEKREKDTFTGKTERICEKIEESFMVAQNALQILMNSDENYDDRLFFIKKISEFYDSETQALKKMAIDMMLPLIDLISNDLVYEVRDSAVQVVIKLLASSSFIDVLEYIQQIFPAASLNGKKSLLSLITSMICSIDPFEDQLEKEFLFENYIDQILLIINDNKNRDLKNFFNDILKSIWTLLPKTTQNYFVNHFPSSNYIEK